MTGDNEPMWIHMDKTSIFYVYETENDTAIGPFTDRATAEEWMTEVVPPEDQQSTDNITGYRIGTIDEVDEWLSSPQYERPMKPEFATATAMRSSIPSSTAPRPS
jgi:hypothetical protein